MSVATLTITSLVLVATLLLVGLGGLGYVTERSRQERRLTEDLSTVTERLAIGLANPLFHFDRVRIDLMLDTAMRDPTIAGIAVQQAGHGEPGGFEVYRSRDAGWKQITVDSAPAAAGLINAEREILFQGSAIGVVKVSATSRFVEQTLRRRFLFQLAYALLFDGFTVAGLYFLLWRVVIRPLRTLERSAKAVRSGGELLEDFEAGGFHGELWSLRQSLGEMVALLQARLRALQQKETTLSAVLNSLPQGISWKDPDGRYLGCNERFARSAGVGGPAAVMGRKDQELSWPNEEAMVQQLDDQAVLRTGVAKRHAMAFQADPDARPVWLEISQVPLLDAAGAPIAVLSVFDDITERRQAEADHARLQEELFQTQKLESIGRLAGGIAHDSNNMLTAIMMHAELLRDLFAPGDPVLIQVRAMETAARRSADLIRQLLAFSRRQVIEPKVIDLNDMLAQFRETVIPLLGEKVRLQIKPAPDLWKVRMDPSQLDQIVMNLVVNARDAMPEGGSIQIEAANLCLDTSQAPDRGNGDYVQLTVNDRGAGMSAEVLEKIFDPFFTTKELGKGTGLGLSTVFGIVKQNDGFLDVQSEPGSGTTFRICLPGLRTGLPEPKVEELHEALAEDKGTILVAEDDEILRNVLSRVLARLGYEFIMTDTPEEAWRVCQRKEPVIDVLLTDVVMPGMSGIELWQKVQVLRPGIKVIFMSGYTAEAILSRGGLGEGVLFLQKPFTTAALRGKLASALAEQGGPITQPPSASPAASSPE